jgi:hypothetical protein
MPEQMIANYPAVSLSITAARRAVEDFWLGHGVEGRLDDIRAAVTEACTCIVARAVDGSLFQIEATLIRPDHLLVVVEVGTSRRGFPRAVGLGLMREFADEVEVTSPNQADLRIELRFFACSRDRSRP